jgi:transposase
MSTPSQDSETDDALEAIAHRCDRCGIGDAPAIKRKGHTLARLCESCAEMLNPGTEDTDDRELIAFRKYRNEAWLRKQFQEEGKTKQEIAELCGCSRQTIVRWLDRHDIETNSTDQATDPRLNDTEWLREQYQTFRTGKSSSEIAAMLDCSADTVLNRLREIGIDPSCKDSRMRDAEWLYEKYYEDNWMMHEIAEECNITEPAVSRWFDKHDIDSRNSDLITDERLTDASWVRDKYYDEGLSTRDIADECDCHQLTVLRWMDKHDIERRPQGGARTA